jgi:multimeric flavodoxin WrbA
MKVLAFNCSPKMSKGNTALILNPFLDGMREEGATVGRALLHAKARDQAVFRRVQLLVQDAGKMLSRR